LHALPIAKLDRRAVAERLSEIAASHGPSAANRVRVTLSGFMTWCAKQGLVEGNPVSFTDKSTESGARTRLLSDDELSAIWKALADDQYGAVVKLLMLLGLRRDEIASLRWSECDLDEAIVTLPPSRTKNRREHEQPLSAPALAILKAQPRRKERDG